MCQTRGILPSTCSATYISHDSDQLELHKLISGQLTHVPPCTLSLPNLLKFYQNERKIVGSISLNHFLEKVIILLCDSSLVVNKFWQTNNIMHFICLFMLLLWHLMSSFVLTEMLEWAHSFTFPRPSLPVHPLLTSLICLPSLLSFSAGDNNQIVTIVPSTTNPGEVSYVLIVEQSGDTDKDDTVYDFNEPDEGLSYVSGGPKQCSTKAALKLGIGEVISLWFKEMSLVFISSM